MTDTERLDWLSSLTDGDFVNWPSGAQIWFRHPVATAMRAHTGGATMRDAIDAAMGTRSEATPPNHSPNDVPIRGTGGTT